jgi:hypothetical protein
MLMEHRTYTLKPGTVAQFVEFFESHDLPFIVPIMGHPVGWYTTEVGPLNQVIQIWAFESFEDRDRRRALVAAHARWPNHLATLAPWVESQTSMLLRPAAFFERRLVEQQLVFGKEP